MAVITLNISHLCIINLLVLCVIANVMELAPLCGTMDGSTVKDDKIYFKDRSQRIRTIEVNGTIYACYPDGTMIDTTSSSSSEYSNERLTESQLNVRIREEDKSVSVRDVLPNRFVANLTKCANTNNTFCTKDDDYPMEFIQKLLRKHIHKYEDVFGSDGISTYISNRNNVFDEIELCDYYEQVIYPTSGKNKDGVELYIFNTPERKQGVRVAMCRATGDACRMTENFPNGYRSACKQQYVYRELLSLSTDGTPIKDKFEFPACCSCAIYRT